MPVSPRVFLGSATENLLPLQFVAHHLQAASIDVTIWNDLHVPPSGFLLEALIQCVQTFDFGIFLFGRDDVVRTRGEVQDIPRDNVIFETGLFMSRLGRERTFVIVPRGDRPLKVLSDFAGLQLLGYDHPRHHAQLGHALEGPCRRVIELIQKMGSAAETPESVAEGPRGVREAINMLETLMRGALSGGRPLHVRNIALDMELTWPFLKELVLDDESARDLSWRSLMIDPASRSIARFASPDFSTLEARERIRDIRHFCNARRADLRRRRLAFACRTYAAIPTLHGFLINDETLLLSVCDRGRKGQLDTRLNPYCIFKGTDVTTGAGRHFTRAFRNWFDYQWTVGRQVWPQELKSSRSARSTS